MCAVGACEHGLIFIIISCTIVHGAPNDYRRIGVALPRPTSVGARATISVSQCKHEPAIQFLQRHVPYPIGSFTLLLFQCRVCMKQRLRTTHGGLNKTSISNGFQVLCSTCARHPRYSPISMSPLFCLGISVFGGPSV